MSNQQQPIGSGFGAASTADEVIAGIDLSGATAVVTGGYSGLGLETVRVLREAGARVIVPARDVERARSALAGIDAQVRAMDLLDPASIAAFAASVAADTPALRILVNSAGIMAVPELRRDARGYEIQFATNHLGHFQLTTALLPLLRAARAWYRCPRSAIATPMSRSTIRTSSGATITRSRPMDSRRRPTSCSRSSSTGASASMACAPSRCIRAASSRRGWASTSRASN
ncbi:Gluconate 5-dehydrogenase [Burkholderia gladioli]|nr:Gluconate 5-dehydrogenase [Burkholderia gladioli]